MNCREDDKIKKQLVHNYNLLCSVIRQPQEDAGSKVDLTALEKIIRQEIPDTLKQNAPENFYELYLDFQAEYGRFKDFILYDKLIGKRVVALGGGFSSGKSSFLNALMAKEHGKDGKTILPEDINPSTSVPTYVVNGDENAVTGINVFDAKMQIDLPYIGKIAHGFGKISMKDQKEDLTDAVTLGHVLETMFFSTPWQKYKNIAFLDTPGYSNPDSLAYSARTDEKIARGQLNASDYILWFVTAESGTVTEADIQFIQSLRQDIPKLIIVSKADAKPLEDLKDVIDRVKKDLSGSGVRYENAAAFSARLKRQVREGERKEFIENQMECIARQLKAWDECSYVSNFARNFKTLFVKCKSFYNQRIDEEERRLARLNTSYTRLGAEEIDMDILKPLELLVKEAQENLRKFKQVREQLEQLQMEFFMEIKRISDYTGIDMPEPEEIDLMPDGTEDIRDVLRTHNKFSYGHARTAGRLKELFFGVNLVMQEQPGGEKYRQKLRDTMRTGSSCISRNSDFYSCRGVYQEVLKKAVKEHGCIAGTERIRHYRNRLRLYQS